MISSDLTISLANWALSIENQRAAVGAQNIANASSGGIKKIGNFEELITHMSKAVSANEKGEVDRLLQTSASVKSSSHFASSDAIALDEEILTLSQAKGRFKVISETLAKKYGLMSLAAGGK